MIHEDFFKRLSLLPLILRAVVSPVAVYAQTPSPTGSAASNVEYYQQKVNELQGQEDTLAKQIGSLDSQISTTQLRVESIKSAITKLGSEIGDLETEIDRLEGALNTRSELVLKRIPESYKRNQMPL